MILLNVKTTNVHISQLNWIVGEETKNQDYS